jgi:hypothetical protein
MAFIKKFEEFRYGGDAPATSPNPTIAPPITKPERPVKPGKPIIQPSVDPQPKAEKDKKKATAEDVANRFIEEILAKGESVQKYMGK